MKNFSVLLWIVIPGVFGFIYPYIKQEPQYLEWLTIGLLIYVLFFSVVIHELSHGLAAYWGGRSECQARRATDIESDQPCKRCWFVFGAARPLYNPGTCRVRVGQACAV